MEKRKLGKFLFRILNPVIFILIILTAGGLYATAKASIDNENGQLVFISNPKPIDLTKMYVQVIGAIKTPGIYEIYPEDRVFEVLERAGGLKDESGVDLSQINLARKVSDGEVLNFGTDLNTNVSTSPRNLTSINTADIQELTNLPGVGISTAEKIIAARPFVQIEDIMNVAGIGESKFAQLKDLISI